MALTVYVGARYAPKFSGAWDKAKEYSALEVVYTNNQSYVSRKTVPANTEITNTEYWIKSSDWNAQVAQYNANVEQYNANVEQYNTNVEQYQQSVSSFYDDTMHSYDTKQDMVDDETLKLGETLLTCGNATVGDGGGGFWQVVGETSANAVALKNGLFAIRVQLEPYNAVVNHDKVPTFTKTGDTSITYNLNISDANSDGIHVYNKVITNDLIAFVNDVTVKVATWSTTIKNAIIKLYIQAAPLSASTVVPYTVTTVTGKELCKAASYNNRVIGINLYIADGVVKSADTFTKEVEAPAVLPSEYYNVTGSSTSTGVSMTFVINDYNHTTACPVRYIKVRPAGTLTALTKNIIINLNSTEQPNKILNNGVTVFDVLQTLTTANETVCDSVSINVNGRNIAMSSFGNTSIKNVTDTTGIHVHFAVIVYGTNNLFIVQSANLK